MRILISESEDPENIGRIISCNNLKNYYAPSMPWSTITFDTFFLGVADNGQIKVPVAGAKVWTIELYKNKMTFKGIFIKEDQKVIDPSGVTLPCIREYIFKIGLTNKDLSELLDIDKATISSLLGGSKELTKWHKASFFYLFETLSYRKTRETLVPSA